MSLNKSIVDLSTKPDAYYNQFRLEMLPYVPSTAQRILDVGCGEGIFGARLKERSKAEVWGIELISSVATVARQRLDRVFAGDITAMAKELPNNYFDAVLFNDVIEHIVDPYQMLLDIKQKLAPGGVVVCSIPNIRYFRNLFNLLFRGEWHYEECGILDKTHLRFFTKKSIHEMFESLGYQVKQLEGINRTPSWRVRLLNLSTFGFLNDTLYLQFACVAQPVVSPT